MATCPFDSLQRLDYKNRTEHQLLAVSAQLLAEILVRIDPTMSASVDFNSVLNRASGNGYGNRTANKLLMVIAQLLCDMNGSPAVAGTNTIYSGNGVPSAALGSDGDIYIQLDDGGRPWYRVGGAWV